MNIVSECGQYCYTLGGSECVYGDVQTTRIELVTENSMSHQCLYTTQEEEHIGRIHTMDKC